VAKYDLENELPACLVGSVGDDGVSTMST